MENKIKYTEIGYYYPGNIKNAGVNRLIYSRWYDPEIKTTDIDADLNQMLNEGRHKINRLKLIERRVKQLLCVAKVRGQSSVLLSALEAAYKSK